MLICIINLLKRDLSRQISRSTEYFFSCHVLTFQNANLRNIREKETFAKQHYGPREINKLVIEIISRGMLLF